MALTVCGLVDEAMAAYRWLASRQLPDGSWFNYYQGDGVKDPRLDTNVCAYLAAGAWHHHLITGDVEFLGELWPTIEKGIDFILRWQQPDGSVLLVARLGRPARGLRPADRARRRSTTPCAAPWPSPSAWPRTARTGSSRPAGWATPWRTTPAPSRPRSSSPWTGTTRCSRARSRARRAVGASPRDGPASSWRGSACAACRRATGSPRPRRPSAS